MPPKKEKPSTSLAIVEDISHEEVTDEQAAADNAKPVPISFEEQKKQEIAKFDLRESAIQALKKKYGRVTIRDIDDKEGYKKAEAAWQLVRKTRIALEKKRKEIKKYYIDMGKAIDEYGNNLVEMITPLEEKLGNELERIDRLKTEEKERIEREAQEKLQQRVALLIENGMAFNGSYYAIGDTISMDVVSLSTLPDFQFEELVSRVKAENKSIQDAKAEEQRKKEAETQRVRKQQEDNENEAQRLRDQQKQIDDQNAKLEKQKKEMAEAQLKIRGQQLEMLGMKFIYTAQEWIFEACNLYISISKHLVETMDDDDINKFITVSKSSIETKRKEHNEKLAKDKEIEERAQARVRQISEIGFAELLDTYVLSSPNVIGDFRITDNDIIDIEPKEWDQVIKKANAFKVEMDNADRIFAEHEARTMARIKELREKFIIEPYQNDFYRKSKYNETIQGLYVSSLTIEDMPDKDWPGLLEMLAGNLFEMLKEEKAEDDRLDKEKEDKRKALLSDKERLREWVARMETVVNEKQDIADSDLNDSQYKAVFQIDHVISTFKNLLKD